MMTMTNPRNLPQLLLIITWTLVSILFSVTSDAQSGEATKVKPSPTVSMDLNAIKSKLEALEADTSIDKKADKALVKLYNKAISNLESAALDEQTALEFMQAEKESPAQANALRQITNDKKEISPDFDLEQYTGAPLEKIEPILLKETADLAAVTANLTKAQETLKFNSERPQIIRQQLIEANRLADGIASEIQNPAVIANEHPDVTQARRWVRESNAVKLGAEIKKLDHELLSHPMRIELLKANVEKAEHSVLFVKERAGYLEQLVNEKRRAKASQVQVEVEESQQEAEGQHSLIQQLAKSNTELSRQINEITSGLKQIGQEEAQISQWAERINQDYKNAKQKLEIAGMSKLLGKVLQEQSRALPDTRLYQKKAKQLEDKIADVSLQQIEYREEKEKLHNLNQYVEEYINAATDEAKQQLHVPINNLATDRAGYLEQLISIQDAYIRAMSELDFSQTRLLEVADNYDEYLDERLLWIRSAPAISFTNFSAIPGQIQNLLSPTHWINLIKTLWQQATSSIYMLLTLIAVTFLLLKDRAMRAALHATGKYIGKPTKDSIRYTLEGIGWTLLLALAWPLLMLSVGLQLHEAISPSAFTRAVSQALILVSEGLFILRAFAILCSKNGVAARHFNWPAASLSLLRRDINILIYTFLPLGFIDIIVINSDFSEQGVGLGRLVFILMMFALTLFFYRVLNPSRGALQNFFIRQKKPTMVGIRYGWLILAVLLPVTAAILAMAGYLNTAGTLVRSFVETMWLLLGLITLQQFVVRWFLVIRGRLALQAAREKREAARQAKLALQEDTSTANESMQDIDEPEIDIATLSEDSLKLLNLTMVFIGVIGTWLIWSEVLPAFKLFDSFTLYQHRVDVAGDIVYKAVTLGDLGLAIVIFAILILLIKRLPAFLEILLRQSASISSGSLYAIKTLTNYALIAIGVVLVFNKLGGNWSQFQWIFAALGVGIGFGLQEIVANFISGLIILFERPIRVGDMVTVGDISGTVTRIQIRATTIRDFDKKELLVPNKEFITSRLLNWSLSDTITRLLLPVGIAYGSDVPLAMKLVQEAAIENDKIIDEPAPIITFDSFGDNALTITARVYIDNLDHRVSAISELHSAINEKFNKAGIVIAFPQRDVHLDTSQPLEIRIKKDGASDA